MEADRGSVFFGSRHKHLSERAKMVHLTHALGFAWVHHTGVERQPAWKVGGRRRCKMPLYMDIHRNVEGLTPEAVAEAHQKDLEVQDEYGVKYHRYWYNDETGEVFCLAEAPSKEAAEAVHREAHGLVADEIIEVREGS
jgi:hypothetical protein